VTRAIEHDLLRSAHAVGPGGLALALARVAMAGELGIRVDLDLVPTEGEISTTEILYSESGGRFVLSVAPADREQFEELFADLPLAHVGRIRSASERPALRVSQDERTILDEDVLNLKKAWKETLHGI